MAEHTQHQKKIIKGYYDHRDEIMLDRLGHIVSELFLTESDKKLGQLWKRAEKAMAALNVPKSVANHILTERKPDLLARHLRTWLDSARKPGSPSAGK